MPVYDINGNPLLPKSVRELVITSANRYTASLSGVQSAFVTPSGKVWMMTESSCYVVNNGVRVTTITLDHTVGHANTTNYDNGYAYVSDWTDGQTIHVFAVDDDNNTLTYVKDITVPTTHGRTQFWVFDNENQIYSCGWDYEHSENSQYMVVELWKKERDGDYVKSWESTAIGITMVQGMCVYNGRMYIIDNTNAYKHLGIVIVDLDSGVQKYDASQTGTILTLESEALVPIGNDQFICVTHNGSQFTLTQS